MLRKSRIFKITILVPFKVSDKGTELTNYFYFIRLTRARFVKNACQRIFHWYKCINGNTPYASSFSYTVHLEDSRNFLRRQN